jgi:hypothetical protein
LAPNVRRAALTPGHSHEKFVELRAVRPYIPGISFLTAKSSTRSKFRSNFLELLLKHSQ